MNKFLCIIPARCGSKGVRGKNIIEINGKPLIQYSIESADESRHIFDTIISTDCDEIKNVVKKISSNQIIDRPREFAEDDSPIEDALRHAMFEYEKRNKCEIDYVVWLQPNVPIREKGLIDSVIDTFVENGGDSAATCYEVDQIPELMKIIDGGFLKPTVPIVKGIRRQEFPPRYLLDGSVIVISREGLIQSAGKRALHSYLGDKVVPFIQNDRKYSLEIDIYHDLELVNFFLSDC